MVGFCFLSLWVDFRVALFKLIPGGTYLLEKGGWHIQEWMYVHVNLY